MADVRWVERCPVCKALDGVVNDDPRDCDYCERDGGKLDPVPVIVAEVTDEMVELAARVIRPFDWGPEGTDFDRHNTRDLARAALTAALDPSQNRQDGEIA